LPHGAGVVEDEPWREGRFCRRGRLNAIPRLKRATGSATNSSSWVRGGKRIGEKKMTLEREESSK